MHLHQSPASSCAGFKLQQIVRNATTGKRHVDKLVEVRRRDGAREWLLVHLEVQSQPDRHLPERMYEYHRRIVERHQKRVVSLAVLADTSPGFRPVAYEEETWGCRLRFEYPICKLRDFSDDVLEREDNPAAIVIAAHRAAQRRARDPVGLKTVKWRLIRRLYERGYTKKDVVELFRLIDWLIQLPAKLTVEINRELTEYEDQKRMPYITSIERIGRRQGRQEGRGPSGRPTGRPIAGGTRRRPAGARSPIRPSPGLHPRTPRPCGSARPPQTTAPSRLDRGLPDRVRTEPLSLPVRSFLDPAQALAHSPVLAAGLRHSRIPHTHRSVAGVKISRA
jgi:hypothetical protein